MADDIYGEASQFAYADTTALQQNMGRELYVEQMEFLRNQNAGAGYYPPVPQYNPGPPTRIEHWYNQARMLGTLALGVFVVLFMVGYMVKNAVS